MKNHRPAIVVGAAAVVFAFLAGMPVSVQEAVPTRGGQEQNGGYEPVVGWPKQVHKGWVGGSNQGVFAESPDRVYITQRGWLPEMARPKNTPVPQFGPSLSFPVNQVPFRNASQGPVASPPSYTSEQQITKDTVDFLWKDCVYVVNRAGEKIEDWTQWDKLLKRPHSIYQSPYDPEKNVWLVDDAGHTVHKFTHDGKQKLLTLGTQDTPGNDDKHFNRPTFLAWLPDGTMFLSDGYANTRVVKFDKNGKFLMTWGQKGSNEIGPEGPPETRPGYFNTVHGIAVDAKRRVYVGDRSNRRIQIFDENGKYLDEFSVGPPPNHSYSLFMAADQTLWSSDSGTMRLVSWDAATGKFKYAMGYLGDPPKGLFGPHQLSVDQEGNLYIAQVSNGYTAKWRPMKGADPLKLVGKPFGFPWAK